MNFWSGGVTSRAFACECYFQRPAARVRATVCTNTCEAPSGCPAWSCRTTTRSRTRRRARRRARRRTPIIRITSIRPASASYRPTISTSFSTTSRRDIRTSWILSKTQVPPSRGKNRGKNQRFSRVAFHKPPSVINHEHLRAVKLRREY